jgi:N6-L-threonylcarbamoyladenine synthase
MQQPSFAYANTSSQRSILKKGSTSPSGTRSRRLQFSEEPTVYSITPIENGEEYYGAYTKMTREERRWSRR